MIAHIVPAVRLPVKASETYDYQVPANLVPAVMPGAVVIVPFAGRRVAGLVISISEKTERAKPLKEIMGVSQGLSPLPPYVVELWTRLSRLFATTLPRFVWAALPTVPSRAVSLVTPERTSLDSTRDRSGVQSILGVRPTKRDWIPAAAGMTESDGGNGKFFFANSSLDALKFVKDAIANAGGRQVLILVPTVDEAAAWAKAIDNARVYHSSLSTGAKYDLASATTNGTAKVVIGTKIAAFLPFGDLGAIVIINAGSMSHLQEDQDPRYDARVIAEELSRATGAALTAIDPLPPLGMTPAGSNERWAFINEPKAFAPIVHDLHDAAKAAKARVLISDELDTAIDETAANGGRVLVVLNRRGVSTAYVCRDCGAMVNCAACGIPLIVHQDRMSCPSCDRLYPLPDSCPKCNGLDLKTVGAGSKTLFEALKKRHPAAAIAHVDRDSWQTNLDAAQIVVGTTAVFGSLHPSHKQFDLVADALLGAGQMKSGIWSTESSARILRTLGSLVAPGGSLHVQTFDPSSPALKALNDPLGFIAKELEERAAFGYPPAQTLITIYGAGSSSRHSGESRNPISLGRTDAQYGLDPRPVSSRIERCALGGDKIEEETLWNTAVELVQTLRSKYQKNAVGDPQWSRPKKFRGKFRLTVAVKVPHGQNHHDLVQYLPVGFAAEVRSL